MYPMEYEEKAGILEDSSSLPKLLYIWHIRAILVENDVFFWYFLIDSWKSCFRQGWICG